ncbi:MAG: hypothetical protein RL672_385 [Actinomycetota bacterium]
MTGRFFDDILAVSVLLAAATMLTVASLGGTSASLAQRLKPELRYRLADGKSGRAAVIERLLAAVRKPRLRSAGLKNLAELGDCLLLLERLLISGDSAFTAIEWMGQRTRGDLGRRFRLIHQRVQAGAALSAELLLWQSQAQSLQEQELASKLLAAVQQGSDVVAVIRGLRESVDGHIRARQLAALGKSETRMLVPLVFLVLPITVLFAVFPSLSLLNASLG